jgi:hypothetical protein
MYSFDQTYTDREFQRNLELADSEWMAALARREPDLAVEGLRGSLLSRVLELFGVGRG